MSDVIPSPSRSASPPAETILWIAGETSGVCEKNFPRAFHAIEADGTVRTLNPTEQIAAERIARKVERRARNG